MGFSVLMSVYKKEKPEYLREALESVINQTLPPDEIVLVEDGPLTPELDAVLDEIASKLIQKQSYKDTKLQLRVVKLEQNQQLGRALAEGLKHCTNELIVRMDTDDIAVSDRFEVQYRYMAEHPEIAVSGGLMEEFDPADESYRKVKNMPTSKENIKSYSRYRNPVNHMTVMFRKAKVEEAGGYRHFPFLEDYDLWTRMQAKGSEFANIDKVFVRARTERDIYKRRGGRKYCRQYLELRKQQRQLGLLNIKEYTVAIVLTIGMTLQPSWLRKLVYQRALRK